MHRTRRTFNSAQIFRHKLPVSLFLLLLHFIDGNFVVVRIKQRTSVKLKTASKHATSHSRIQMCITCQIHERVVYTNNANSVHSRHFVGGKMACNSLCLPMHTDTHTTPYTFSKRKQQQTACGTYPIEHIRQFLDCVHPRVSFILFLYCCNCYDYFRRS